MDAASKVRPGAPHAGPAGGRLPAILLGAYLAWWAALAIAPADRLIWFFENLLVFVGLPLVVLTSRRFRFGNASYAAMFAFLCIHAVGAHYGYANVPLPWREWGFARNHSDRVVHFAFGLLAVLPFDELLGRLGRVRGGWREALALACTFAVAAAFELVEWGAVTVGGDATGPNDGGYLGWQGDEFDAVKDMAMALLGAALTAAALVAARLGQARIRLLD